MGTAGTTGTRLAYRAHSPSQMSRLSRLSRKNPKHYAKGKKVPALAKGTTLHLILVQYRGPAMANCELVAEKKF